MRRVIPVLVLTLVAACTGDGAESTTTTTQETTTATAVIPSAEELAAALLVPEDLGRRWVYPDDPFGTGEVFTGGVITAEWHLATPFGEAFFCPAIDDETVELIQGIPWQALTHLWSGPGTDPATDVAALLEFLVAGDPAEVRGWFETLEAAATACAGIEWEENRAEMIAAPSVGDDSFEWHGRVASGLVPFDDRLVIVLDGSILMAAREYEMNGPIVTSEELSAIVTTAVDKLPRASA